VQRGWSALRLVLVTLGLSIGITVVLLGMTAAAVGWYAHRQWQIFTAAANTSWSQLKPELEAGLSASIISTDDRKNILLLGTDSLPERGVSPALTDTMLLISLNTKTASVSTLPFPRDLWSDEYQTRINALYSYGYERDSSNPATFPTQVLSDLTGLPIHHTVVVSLEDVKTVIDLVGGVEINVPVGFVDPLFPRPGVDVTKVTDPQLLYETVRFEPGLQTMSGQQALAYIRSRHAADDEGTDQARSARQQLVIESLVTQLTNPSMYLSNPKLAGQLFAFYQQKFATSISLRELIATARTIWPIRQQLKMNNYQLPIYPDDPNGIIFHPPVWQTQNQWVYKIRDPQLFKSFVSKMIY
jgi:LCP family protein required for cell wall assembly